MEAGSRITAFIVVFFVLVIAIRTFLNFVPSGLFDWFGSYRFSVYALLNLLCSVVAIIVSRYGLDSGYRNLGLRAPFGRSLVLLGTGFIIGSVFVSIVIGLTALFGGYKILSIQYGVDFLPYLVLFLIGAFHEELVFRGYFYQLIERGTTETRALLIASMLFGYAHMINDVAGASFIEKFTACSFLTFEAGLPLTIAFVLTRNIWFALGLHWAWNFVQGAIFGANVSGLELGDSFITANLTEGILGGGGGFGPEYTVVGLLTGLSLYLILVKVVEKNKV